MKVKLLTSLGGALLALCFTLPANASSLLTFYNDLPAGTERFTVSCTLGCDAYEGTTPTTWGLDGDLFETGNSGSATEIAKVNAITGETYTSMTKDETGTETFTSNAEYILIKIGRGPNVGLIRNALAGNMFTFTATGQGAGLSHVTEFGQVSAVPVPASVWLFGTALIGFIGFSRRTKV